MNTSFPLPRVRKRHTVSSRESQVTRVTGQLTDGSRGHGS